MTLQLGRNLAAGILQLPLGVNVPKFHARERIYHLADEPLLQRHPLVEQATDGVHGSQRQRGVVDGRLEERIERILAASEGPIDSVGAGYGLIQWPSGIEVGVRSKLCRTLEQRVHLPEEFHRRVLQAGHAAARLDKVQDVGAGNVNVGEVRGGVGVLGQTQVRA